MLCTLNYYSKNWLENEVYGVRFKVVSEVDYMTNESATYMSLLGYFCGYMIITAAANESRYTPHPNCAFDGLLSFVGIDVVLELLFGYYFCFMLNLS